MTTCGCPDKYGPLLKDVRTALDNLMAKYRDQLQARTNFVTTFPTLTPEQQIEFLATNIQTLISNPYHELSELRKIINTLPTTSEGKWVDVMIEDDGHPSIHS